MLKHLIVCATFIFVIVSAGKEKNLREIDSIYMEEPCLSSGGMCTKAEDCPGGALAKSGLCPQQRSLGVECCYGLSKKETRCEKRGGWCMPKGETCNENLVFSKATDCPANTKCCILV